MYAPEGYVSLAILWREFVAQHSNPICDTARSRYAAHPERNLVEFGSPADLVEQTFLDSFSENMFSLCALGQPFIDVVASDKGRYSRLLTRMSCFESTLAATEDADSARNEPWFSQIGTTRFRPWPELMGEKGRWAEIYVHGEGSEAKFDELPYHTLPMTFERHRFVVPTELPPWADDPIDEFYVPRVLPHGLGRSVCLSQDQASEWRNRVLRPKWCRTIGMHDNKTARVGRPPKQAKALRYYKELFPDGHKGTWKEAVNAIEEKFGFPVNEKTLKRAIENEKKLRQNAGQNPARVLSLLTG